MKKFIFTLLILVLLSSIAFAQSVEIQGQTYRTVKIGNQTWMAENLNVKTFQNGDTIPVAYDEEEWWLGGSFAMPACADVIFDEDNGRFFGKLYNYLAITDERGIAPAGWRVPTDADWSQLAEALGGSAAATAKLKSTEGWSGNNGTDESGFTAYPIGMIDVEGFFEGFGDAGYWWSITMDEEDFVLNRNLSENRFPFEKAQSHPLNGMAVRLVKID